MKESFEGNSDKIGNPLISELIDSLSPEEKEKISKDVSQWMAHLDSMTPEELEKLDIHEYLSEWGPHGGYDERYQEEVKGREMPKTHSPNRKK